MDPTNALLLINTIDEGMAQEVSLNAPLADILERLSNVDTSRRQIEDTGIALGEEICLRLNAIASSVYLGTLRRGRVGGFYETVMCLGLERAKILIIMLAFQHLSKKDHEIEVVFAKAFSTSVMATILAAQTGFREDAIKKAELCSLFLEIGRKAMILYKKSHPADAAFLTDNFIDTYHPYLGEKMVRRYRLPNYIGKVILARQVILEENTISLPGIVYMAHDMVENSFRKHHNRLVLRCQIPRPQTDVTRTLEAIVTEKFRAVGLEKYLHILRVDRMDDLW